jgi:hypothetical protein
LIQRLVVEYIIEGDGYESSDQYYTVCCEYESPEAFLVHFEEKLKDIGERLYDVCTKEREKWNAARNAGKRPVVSELYRCTVDEGYIGFELAGQVWRLHNHAVDLDGYNSSKRPIYTLPDVYTLEEWFSLRLREPR